MHLASAFAQTALSNWTRTALCWEENEFSYGQLWEQTVAVGDRLRTEFGVQPGDRVGIWLRNCPEFVPALFGIFHAGAVAVPINNFLKPNEVSHIITDAGISILLIDESMAEGFARLKPSNAGLRELRVECFTPVQGATPQKPHALPASAKSSSELALIIYTSGTTGRSKGAMLSHANLLHNVRSCQIVLETVGSDRFAVLLPMFHSFMLTVGILLPLLSGGSLVLVKSLQSPKNIIQDIIEHRATILPAVPQFFRALTAASLPAQLPMRLCISGGAPLPGQILKDFTARFPIPLLEGYGLSEASPVVTLNPVHGPWKVGSIGVPIPNVEVSVQDEAGNMLPDGVDGEICVRGGNVMQGYWNQPEESAKTIRNGWLLTGDLGHRDSDGYFFITDRKKDMLLVNGINVYPREIEETLYLCPGVKEVAVIGVPDARRGEQPLAFVVLNENVRLDEDVLLGFARERLADYKLPRRIVFLAALPRNASGKVSKVTLRQQVTAEFSDSGKGL